MLHYLTVDNIFFISPRNVSGSRSNAEKLYYTRFTKLIMKWNSKRYFY